MASISSEGPDLPSTPPNLEVRASSVDLQPDALVVVWADGHTSRFELVELRQSCTCAQCRELREQGQPIWPKPGVPETLAVEDAELVGAWGLSLRWNDRHETGIYQWDVLRAWCPCEQCAR